MLKDITGIVYGGISSRFWMLRKHMMNLDSCRHKHDRVPFKSWECISLQLGNRDVDLVIPNQTDMDDLIAVVVKNMNTVDGNKGSA